MGQGTSPGKEPPASPAPLGPLLARFVVVIVGLTGVFATGYGIFGTWVITNDWLSCVNPYIHAMGDYPSGYCETVPWPSQFALGIGLLVGGMVAVGAALWLLRSRYAARAPRT